MDAVFGAGRVLAERGKGGNSALFAWYETSGTALHHRPDAVVVNYKGPGTYLLIDVKTFDGSGATHVVTSPTTTPTVSALQRTWPRSGGAEARTTGSRRSLPSRKG